MKAEVNKMMELGFFVILGLFSSSLGKTIPSDVGPKIVGGHRVDIEQFPYQLALYRSGSFICGASIISQEYALTAAHCVVDDLYPTHYKLISGSDKLGSGSSHSVSKIYVHPKYSSRTFSHDAAVLKVSELFLYDDDTQSITLAIEEATPSSDVTVSGFGVVDEDDTEPSNILLAVTVPVVDRDQCKRVYSNLTPQMICAGSEGHDSCQGDSGGPAVLGNELVGIVSFGAGCGQLDTPGVYTNVADYEILSFINLYLEDSKKKNRL